jgi:hypothetical protein
MAATRPPPADQHVATFVHRAPAMRPAIRVAACLTTVAFAFPSRSSGAAPKTNAARMVARRVLAQATAASSRTAVGGRPAAEAAAMSTGANGSAIRPTAAIRAISASASGRARTATAASVPCSICSRPFTGTNTAPDRAAMTTVAVFATNPLAQAVVARAVPRAAANTSATALS